MEKDDESGLISYNEISEIQESADKVMGEYCKKKLKEAGKKIRSIKDLIDHLPEDDLVKPDLLVLLYNYTEEEKSLKKELSYLKKS
ncbi:MAG: hypothetical protein ABFR75_00595 [Acidobacteriota bacterium]